MTELRVEPYEIPAADLGPENPLPVFRAEREDADINVDARVTDEEKRYLGWRIGSRVMPHRIQDGYSRDKRLRAFRSLVLENDVLRATFIPELGGRMVSLVHKPQDRELLERNPVFQPANLALRNAWFSGGIEWNTSQFGHYFLTCSPVFAARVTGTQGEPVLRLYEWDRVKCFPWQIDLHLPPGSEFLFARVRVVNPHDDELAMYWWTNMGVRERPDIRTIAPAYTAFHDSHPGLAVADLPQLDGRDITYSTNSPFAKEFFFRISEDQRRWITVVDGDGMGFVEASTARLRGRKMFVWGMNPGGRRWQEYLAVPGSHYLEIQAGLARTQLEHLPMPANAEWTWTEAFGSMEVDPAKAHSLDWGEAVQAVSDVLDERLPQEALDALDAGFAAVTVRAPEELMAEGSGWGALERLRLQAAGAQDRVPAELVFAGSTLGPDQEPWLRLLETGALPERDAQDDPGQAMVQPEWRELLEESVRSGLSDHWLAWLHLGCMRMEAFDPQGAREAWETSLERKRSAWALRNLAVLEQRAGNHDAACDLLRQAWEAGPKVVAIALEYARALLDLHRHEDLRKLISELPDGIRDSERLRIIAAREALSSGRYQELEGLFDREFVSVREGEVTLSDLWFGMHEQRIAAEEGIPVDDGLRERVRRDFPPPHQIDFRMSK